MKYFREDNTKPELMFQLKLLYNNLKTYCL